jgi:hypothetical protein
MNELCVERMGKQKNPERNQSSKKIKQVILAQCLAKQHAMKRYGGAEL